LKIRAPKIQAPFSEKIIGALPYLAAALFSGLVVHLLIILAMPHYASKDAYARLSSLGPAGQLTLLPQAEPQHESRPFIDPNMIEAVCPYDLSSGPYRIATNVSGDGLLSLAFLSRKSQIFYSMTDRSALRGRIDIALMTQSQSDAAEANDVDDAPPQELRLVAPTRQGIIVARALVERRGEVDSARARLEALACGPVGAKSR
jgi:uncharacterized membrane protein